MDMGHKLLEAPLVLQVCGNRACSQALTLMDMDYKLLEAVVVLVFQVSGNRICSRVGTPL